MSDDLTLRGYRIVCDVREVPDTRIWMGKASVVKPADARGIERIHKIVVTACFTSEQAAFDHLIADAKKWIGKQTGDSAGISSSRRQHT